MQYTPGYTVYCRLSAAIEAQDLATLQTLYHPDAVSLFPLTGQVLRGREAILDAFARTFQIAGAISSRYETLVEAAGAVCVEARLSTRSGELQTYDVYMLQSGMVKRHVGGLISPRPPIGQGSAQGLPQTPGGAFYRRYCQALEARNFATLESLYHPDMISVDCITNKVRRGRAAILGLFKQATANGGYVKLNSVEGFVESSEIICAEVTQTTRIVNRMGPVQSDALTYEVSMLRAGQIVQHFSGAISPRGPQLQQAVRQQNDLSFELARERQEMIRRAFQDSLNPRRNPLQ